MRQWQTKFRISLRSSLSFCALNAEEEEEEDGEDSDFDNEEFDDSEGEASYGDGDDNGEESIEEARSSTDVAVAPIVEKSSSKVKMVSLHLHLITLDY